MAEMNLSRRGLMAGAAMLLTAGAAKAQGAEGAVVETSEGRYRGRVESGVQVFRGMRYGADTSGAGGTGPTTAGVLALVRSNS